MIGHVNLASIEASAGIYSLRYAQHIGRGDPSPHLESVTRMLTAVVKHGQFRLSLAAYSRQSAGYLACFLEQLPPGVVRVRQSRARWQLTLVTDVELGELLSVPVHGRDNTALMRLRQTLISFKPRWRDVSLFDLASKGVCENNRDFVYLIRGESAEEVYYRLSLYLLRLKALWLVSRGALPVHACAVARSDASFLFVGESGAGKTTVAEMSKGASRYILNDERVFIVARRDGYFLQAIPGSVSPHLNGQSNASCTSTLNETVQWHHEDSGAPLRALFVLKKDQQDQLFPLPSPASARALTEGYLQSPEFLISAIPLTYAFQTLSAIARRVPAYELHFRKSPDFWKLIDERFPA